MFLHDTPKDWAFQVHINAYAHNSQPLSELIISPHEIVFHTRPRIPLTFDLNLNRHTSKTCISRYCSKLPEYSQYDKSDLNPFFNRTLSKPIPHWFVAVETALLQIYSTVYENTLRKINSHAYITKTYHEGKPLPNPFFYRTFSKPIPQWLLAVETAMLQIYSTVYENTKNQFTRRHYKNLSRR